MSLLQLHHTAFSAGVLAPAFWGRSDVDTFDRGLAEAVNFYVDYRGGVKNRPGTQFITEWDSGEARFWPFAMGNYADDFLLLFTNVELHAFFKGAFVLSGGVPFTISTPWQSHELSSLRFAQKGLTLTVTHENHAPREVTYNPDTGVWTVTQVDFLYSRTRSRVDSVVSSAAGTANFVVAVSVVGADGKESMISRPWLEKSSVDFSTTAGWCRYVCIRVPGARKYRWYRSIIANAEGITISQNLGFIGESYTPTFVDNNIIPNFSRPPPEVLNPFAGGQILSMTVGAGGSGYHYNGANIVKTAGPGTGFIGYPIIEGGVVQDVLVMNWGKDYVDGLSTFAVVDGGGTGATIADIEVGPASSHPKLVAYFQQRRIFASSTQLPTGLWGSEVGDYSQFSARPVPLDSESYQIYADVPGNDYISHILPLQDSILLFHSYGVARLRGGAGVAITPNSNIIEPQTSIGAGEAEPVLVNRSVVYTSPRGESIHALSFQDQAGGFVPEDLSTFVRHYFSPGQRPKKIVWQPEPDRIMWVLMENGKLFSLTFVPEQEVFAWSEHEMHGRIVDIICVREKERDVVYLFVQRHVGGVLKYFVEMMADRRVNHVEEAWFLDCALASSVNMMNATGSIRFHYENTGYAVSTFSMTTDQPCFNSSHLGWHIRTLSGLFKITTVNSSTSVEGVIIDYPGIEEQYSEEGWHVRTPYEWSLDEPKKEFSGMGHLALHKVNILADGSFYQDVVVTADGRITLPEEHSRVIVGIPYESRIKSLPLSSREVLIEGKKKRIVGVKVRISNSRGMVAGNPRRQFPMRDTSFHEREENLQLRSGVVEISIDDSWKIDNHLVIRQTKPLPAEILGYVIEVEA